MSYINEVSLPGVPLVDLFEQECKRYDELKAEVYEFFIWYHSLPWWKRVLKAILGKDLTEGWYE